MGTRLRCLAGSLLLVAAATALPAREWELVNPLPTSADLAGVACGPPGCVAVGEAGTVLVAADGVAWAVAPSPTTAALRAVTWSGRAFVAVGEGGTVLTSPDGAAWRLEATPTGARLEGVTAGPAGLLVAVGEAGTILVSTDGAGWQPADSGVAVDLNDTAWADSAFVAVGDAVGWWGTVVASRDARSWAAVDARLMLWGDLSFVAAHGDRVVLGGALDGPLRATVAAGRLTDPAGPRWGYGHLHHWPQEVRWCRDRWVGASWGGRHSSSPDGVEWWETPSAAQQVQLVAVACGPAGAVAVGPGGQVATSPDAEHWRRATGLTEAPLELAGCGGPLVALSRDDDEAGWDMAPVVLRSEDGAAWSDPQPLPSPPGTAFLPAGLAAGGGRFVAAGTAWVRGGWEADWRAAVATSRDGVTWSFPDLGWRARMDEFFVVTWDGSRFFAVGWPLLATSADGVTWQVSETTGDSWVRGVASDGSTLVAVAAIDPPVIRCADGATWEGVELPVQGSWRDVAFAAGRFVVVGLGGAILSSQDGLAWEERRSGTTSDLLGVDRVGDGFVVTGANGTLLESADGMHFVLEPTGLHGDLLSAAPGPCGPVVAGSAGLIARSRCEGSESLAAAFTWRPPVAVAGEPVALLDRSDPPPDRWRWELGDDRSSTAPEVVHTWSEPGSHPVTLHVGDGHGTATVELVLDVVAPCAAPGAPAGLTAPASVVGGERFELSWAEVAGVDFYRLERCTLEPSPCERLVAADRVDGTSVEVIAWPEWGATVEYRVRAVRDCFDGEWRSPWSEPVTVAILPAPPG